MGGWYIVCMFFFFKQKTAYEMRISDWSSDVCSSDLPAKLIAGASAVYGDAEVERMYGEIAGVPQVRVVSPQDGEQLAFGDGSLLFIEIGRASCRERVCQYV